MGQKSDFMGLNATFGQVFVQHSERHAALCAWTLVNGRGHGPGTDMWNELGEKVGGNDNQAIESFGIARRLQHWD